MPNENVESLRGMVFGVLKRGCNEYFSVSEIVDEIYRYYCTNTKPHNIPRAIAEIRTYNDSIADRMEPRGKNRIPTKTFSYLLPLPKKEETICSE